ncbi:hypothetical protein [uncultured Faecalicoccus sp.]|nr:hypothetical protein [uncultured Faecalicoccus sp.]
MEWLNEGSIPEDQIEPQCLVNVRGCVVELFGICIIAADFPPG